ncbi:MAG: LuxR C-terminal-related transcriptional regulator, partial [Nakamurella sp.]
GDSSWLVDARRVEQGGLPSQRVAQQNTGTAILLADPVRDTREVLTQGLLAGGIARVLVAESPAQVDDLIASGQHGQLALVSLAFGASAARLIDGVRHGLWDRVIALAPTADPQAIVVALQAGACGVLRGHPTTKNADHDHAVHQLTEREIEVLAAVAEGRSNQWIGEQLSLSALTIKSHLARISRKLGTGDRAHMVAITMRAGLIA